MRRRMFLNASAGSFARRSSVFDPEDHGRDPVTVHHGKIDVRVKLPDVTVRAQRIFSASGFGMTRLLFVLSVSAAALAAAGESERILRDRAGFSESELLRLTRGMPVVRELPAEDPNEVLLLGAIRVAGDPGAFVAAYEDVESLVDGKSFLAARKLHEPPEPADLDELRLDAKDLEQLRRCRPGDCDFQLPAGAMQAFRAAASVEQANAMARRMVWDTLLAYRSVGNPALGAYHDKAGPADVDATFRRVLRRAEGLPGSFPAFHRYLLEYPAAPAPDLRGFFYWERVAFGLKPVFRVNHVVIHRPPGAGAPWLIANKQLYSSHYFQTAIDLWMCLREPGAREFVLVTWKGSRQEGLTGPKGRLLRSVALKRTREALDNGLTAIKLRTEAGPRRSR